MDKNLLYILITLLISTACVKQTDWPLPDGEIDLIVVDATLTSEFKAQSIRLSYPMAQLNEEVMPVEGASVIISNQDEDWILKEDKDNPGTYWTDSTFIALLNKSYTLQIFNDNKYISASAAMVPGRFFNPLTYSKNDNNDLYHIDYVASNFDPESNAKWEVLIDWTAVPGYENADPDTCRARMLFYTLPTLDVNQIFAPEVEKISFPAGSIITERRYSLTAEHAAYVRDLLLESTWQGSMFPTAHSNVDSNLSEGGTGYFGVCFVTELSFKVASD